MKATTTTTLCILLAALLGASAFAAAGCCAAAAVCGKSAVADNTLTPDEKAAGFKLLFDGKTFDGWACTASDMKGWELDNGAVLYNVKGGGYLYTKERFGDFELKIDFMVDHGTNSGIFFRWANLNDPVQTGIEMQVLDSSGANKPSRHDCGAIYDVLAPSENAMKPALEWNTCVIKCRKNFITITMNDKRIIQMDLDAYTQPHKNIDGTRNKFNTAYKDVPREGHIGLQEHGGKVWYKNIKIRELE